MSIQSEHMDRFIAQLKDAGLWYKFEAMFLPDGKLIYPQRGRFPVDPRAPALEPDDKVP